MEGHLELWATLGFGITSEVDEYLDSAVRRVMEADVNRYIYDPATSQARRLRLYMSLVLGEEANGDESGDETPWIEPMD
jgi:hypothetical protein